MISRGPQRPLILIMYILKDIVNITSTKLPSEKSQNYISTENMLPNKGGITPTAHVPQTGTVSIYQKGDTLISNIRPYFKKIWHARIEGTASNDILIFHPTEKVNDLYLYYLLSDDRFFAYVMTGAKGTKMPRGDKAQILQYPVSLPSLEEQKRIAGVLGAFDDKIELLQKQNTTLENMAKALFKSWFVDFDVVHAKQQGQPKAAVIQQYHLTEELYNLFPSSFEPSTLGPIPTGWQVRPINSLLNIISGFAFKSKDYQKCGNYKLVTIRNVQDGIFIPEVKDYLTVFPANMPINCKLNTGDILLSLTGNVGRVCLVIGQNYLLNQRVAKIEALNKIDHFFIYLLFRQKKFLKQMQELAVGSAQQNLSPILTGQILFCMPSRLCLDSFHVICQGFYNKIINNHKQIQTLTEMRDALLPRLISGKIRV